MKHARILLHAFLALVPVFAGMWIVRGMSRFQEFIAYNCTLGCLIIFGIALGSFVPQIVLVAVRNARFVPGDVQRIRAPLHPVGWVTVWGTWACIPMMWIASRLSGEFHAVSFSLLAPPLIVLSVVLSWRYVLKNEPPSATRPKGSEIDGLGPSPDEF
ncbi:MAG TPA: hypothetical protein VJU16_07550 [Planctomycetota bacterium]|nr:hypothetical protein [Planctomycetota bacterium]